MKFHRIARVGALFIFITIMGTACQTASKNNPIVAEGSTELNSKQETIRIEMTKGKEMTELDPGPFQGVYRNGEFDAVAVGPDGVEHARIHLNDAFAMEAMSFRKDKPFVLQFDDYNGDGNPEFTIGQWGGSNGNNYSIISIGLDGFHILEMNIYSSDHRNSIRYRKVGSDAFVNQYYDQEKGYLDVLYRWKGGQFVEEAPIQAKEIHAAGRD